MDENIQGRENLMQRQSDQAPQRQRQQALGSSLQDDIGNCLSPPWPAHLHSSDLALYPDRIGFSARARDHHQHFPPGLRPRQAWCWRRAGVCSMPRASSVPATCAARARRQPGRPGRRPRPPGRTPRPAPGRGRHRSCQRAAELSTALLTDDARPFRFQRILNETRRDYWIY